MREESYAVILHGEHVGSLQRRDEFTKLVLDRDYWQRSDRSVLGQWFETHRRARPHDVRRVPAWFSNLLPEGRLRELIAREQGVRIYAEIDLLVRTGNDLPGAAVVSFEDVAQAGPGFEAEVGGDVPAPVTTGPKRVSLAGMALKFSVRRKEDRLTVPVRGEDGDWILKTPDPKYPGLPANEYAIMRLADQIGIDVPEIALWDRSSIDDLGPGAWPTEEARAYAIRRFDRTGQGRVHIEDFAQVLGQHGTGDGKYRSTVEMTAAIAYRRHDHASLQELVRRTVFNLLVGNGDAHIKNWSLIYPDRRTARLSPAYDLVCTAPLLDDPDNPRLGLPFFGASRLNDVTREQFVRLQDSLRVGPEDVLDVVDETLERFIQAWSSGPEVPPDVGAWIGGHLAATTRRLTRPGH